MGPLAFMQQTTCQMTTRTTEQRIFNDRLSRARRVVENAFGILAQRWQILHTTMQHDPETIRLIVEACLCLHNLMRTGYAAIQNAVLDMEDANHKVIPGAWRIDARMVLVLLNKQSTGRLRNNAV